MELFKFLDPDVPKVHTSDFPVTCINTFSICLNKFKFTLYSGKLDLWSLEIPCMRNELKIETPIPRKK